MEKALRVFIVEDEVMIAMHIRQALNSSGMECIGVAHDDTSAISQISELKPDFVILDINIEGERDGIEVAEFINKNFQCPFIFLTAFSDVETLDRAKKVNPCGYLVKPFKQDDLLSSITIGLYNYSLRAGKKEFSLDELNKIIATPMSNKEYAVLLDMKDGLTNAQIANKQFLSLSTIKFHSQNIYSKLDVKNRTSAVKFLMDTFD